jgi:hypothetical protein
MQTLFVTLTKEQHPGTLDKFFVDYIAKMLV